VCSKSGAIVTLTNATPVGTITWFKSTNQTTWTAVAASATVTATSLATGNLTYAAASPTTWYKAVATNGACKDYSNVVSVTVSPAAVAKTISGNAGATTQATAVTICSATTKLLTYNTTGSVGTIQWQYINVGTNASTTAPLATDSRWADVPNATIASTYNAPSVAQTGNVWFRVKVSSSPCSDAFSPAVNVWLKACPASVRTVEKPVVAFEVVASPNPFTNSCNLNLITSSNELVQVHIYDMIGKLIDKTELTPSAVNDLQLGTNYPSGVYNVIVRQDNNVKTVRVIKR